MSFPPTARQMRVLRYIHGYQVANGGVSPTLREIAAACGCVKSEVKRCLDALVQRSLISRLPRRERAIEVLRVPRIPTTSEGQPLYFISLAQLERGQ